MQSEKGEKRHLASAVRLVWAAQGLATIFFLGFLTNYLFSSLSQPLLWIRKEDVGSFFASLALAGSLIYLIYIELKYRNYFFILADNELIIRSGVLNTQRVLIPYAKIQNVNASRNVFQRVLGTATLKIETAGGNPGEAEGCLPSVSNYKALVSDISQRMKKAKKDSMHW